MPDGALLACRSRWLPTLAGWCAFVMPLASPAAAQQRDDVIRPDATMLRYPALSGTHIAFGYANELYMVDRRGGMATRLADPPGRVIFPEFSPDGRSIVFAGGYEGAYDIYRLDLIDDRAAGIAQRLTHHPGTELPMQWLRRPDGTEDILFWSTQMRGLARADELSFLDPQGGLPEPLPLPYGGFSTVAPDGRTLAWTPHSREFRTWKRYRGGQATDIWLFDLETFQSERITDAEANDAQPMFIPGGDSQVVYYVSDDGPAARMNIWSYDRRNGQRTQVTRFEDLDVRFPTIGPGDNGGGEIVFQAGPSLYAINLATGQQRELTITIPGDRPTLRPRQVDYARYMQNASLSPEGKRMVVEARGDLFSVPVEEGVTRRLTATSGIAERDPLWSPDGRWIAYLADDPEQSGDGVIGEYEIYLTQSDGRGETRKLTDNADTFRFLLAWSPDSEHLVFGDSAGNHYLLNVETGEQNFIVRDVGIYLSSIAWSHDSEWFAMALTDPGNDNDVIHLYEMATASLTPVTSNMFDSTSPVFDNEGDFLYFVSNRRFAPEYGQIERTWIYTDATVVLGVPLRDDVENPHLTPNEDVEWEDEADAEDAELLKHAEPWLGVWALTLFEYTPTGNGAANLTVELEIEIEHAHEEDAQPDEGDDEIELEIAHDTGPIDAEIDIDGIEIDAREIIFADDGDSVTLRFDAIAGRSITLELAIDEDDAIAGTWTDRETADTGSASAEAVEQQADDEAEGNGDDEGADPEDEQDEQEDKPVEIQIDGFESRAIRLNIPHGIIRGLSIDDEGNLVYFRGASYRGTGSVAGIYTFDPADPEAEQQALLTGGYSRYTPSADAKKLLIRRGGSRTSGATYAVVDTAPAQSFEPLDTSNMKGSVDRRAEWRQILTDAWRIYRDYFYDPNMHNVDWRAIHDQYAAMLPDAVAREDVTLLVREMIGELNVGHAYYSGGDSDAQFRSAPRAGLLGVDFELAEHDGVAAYRIAHIHQGGPWDDDARGPLSQPGIDVKPGDFLLAVNGTPVDITKDPFAAFLDTAGKPTEITVSDQPVIDDDARHVIIEPMASENALRYRSWVERNRAYVEQRSQGRIGYVYVPDTSVNGQNELVRQFQGQHHKDALLIDERWNGGGQIPTRFIELLNRPTTNYFAWRETKPWRVPSHSHNGPKAMLINGRAGSGGDMLPWLFRNAGLGPLIGGRTWGGLVGISYNPHQIDHASISVPRFAFYELDGTWGVEGYGVAPDIEVLADPALLAGDNSATDPIRDPQLDAAIDYLLEELERNPPLRVPPPPGPDRRGPGIIEQDR